MAEQAPSLDAQVEALAQRWNQIFAREQARFAEVGIRRDVSLDRVSGTLEERREVMSVEDTVTDFARAVEALREERKWRDVEATPEYQAWEREQARPFHGPDADVLEWQAEQRRFYAEQDPASEWYREDLYHGEPGPDVAMDLTEAELRQQAAEQRFVEQEAYENRPYAMREEQAHGEAPYAQTRAALLDALQENYALQDQYRPHSAERLDLQQEARELLKDIAGLNRGIPPVLEVDTGDPNMGPAWQAQLEQLDARLDALSTDREEEDFQRHVDHTEGMSY